jgi:YidC/Oxa1 family membrane protein insertase
MNSILNPIAKPIAWVLAAFYSVIPNFGVAIIGLSLIWMILIAPLTLKSTRSMLAMQALQPEIKRLQDKHRNDKQAFAQAQMDLFRERKVSPLSSCLPSILPLPVFIALFRVIDGLSTKSKGVPAPRFLNQHTAMYHAIVSSGGKINAFGLNLADGALSHHSSAAAAIPFFVLLLIMIGTSYLQTAMMMNRNPAASQNPQMKYMKYLPLAFGVICIRFPAGVVLYYAVSNICRIGQQYAMYRWDPRVRALLSDEVREVEARTRDIDIADAKRGYHLEEDDSEDDDPAPRRQSLRELLADSRKSTPPAKEPTKPGGSRPSTPRAGSPKAGTPNPMDATPKDRPGSVKANRNRNGNGQPARPSRIDNSRSSVKGSGTPSKAAGSNGSNGRAAPDASKNGSSGNGAKPANGRSSSRSDAVTAKSTGTTGAKANGTTGAKANGTAGANSNGVTGAKTNGATGAKTNGATGAKTNGATGAKTNGTAGARTNRTAGGRTNRTAGARTNGATGAKTNVSSGAKTNVSSGAKTDGAAGAKTNGAAGSAVDRKETAKSATTGADTSPPRLSRWRRKG